MEDNQQALKQVSKIALAGFLLLLAGAIFYYKERILFSDASFIAFNVINNGRLYIQELRYGSFITQMVPLICSKMHLSIYATLMAYSVSFNLFFLAVAACLVWGYRQYGLAILMSLYYLLFVSETYFWTNNEIHQAVAWMFLLFGTTLYLGKRQVRYWVQVPIFILLGALTVSTHFLVIIPCIFLWVYLIIEKKNWPFDRRHTIIFSALLFVLMVTKFIFSLTLAYDGPHLHDPTHFSLHDILNTFGNILVIHFLQRCVTIYWVAILLYAAGITALIMQKERKLLTWTLLSTLGYIIAMKLAFGGYGDMLLFYIESEWASLSIIIGAPFVFYFLPRLKTYQAIVVFVFIFAVRITYILMAAPVYEERTHFKESVLAKMKEKNITKLVLDDQILRNRYIGDWSLADESILLSALKKDAPQRTFIFATDDISGKMIAAGDNSMIESYNIIPSGKLNSVYFMIDTITPYIRMTTGELFK